MADPTRPPTPAPDDPWSEPADPAVRRVLDALAAPATPEELADESRYVAAFLAHAPTRRERPVRRLRRTRLALAGGVAALAVTGTAAALTVSSSRSAPDADPRTTTTAPDAAAGTSPPGLTGAYVPPTTTAGAGDAPRPTPTPPAGSSTKSPAGAPGTPGTPAASRRPPTPALRAFCRSFQRGKLTQHSHGYRELVAAAGSPAEVPAYCAALD